MSFLIKGVLKTLLKQYLNIVDDINMEKGFIQLPSGHLNHATINANKQLMNAGISILNSQYIGLAISIPLMQILARPIVIRAQNLKAVIQIDDQKKHHKSNNSQKSKVDEQIIQKQIKSQGKKTPKKLQKQANESYIKGLVNRLLANMQIQLQNLEILVIHKQKYGIMHSYRIQIKNLLLKNSLSLLQANLLKKIASLGSIQVQRLKDTAISIQQFLKDKQLRGSQQFILGVNDLNMSLNIDYKKINAIVLLDSIKIKIQDIIILQLISRLLEQQTDRIILLKQKYRNNSQQQPNNQQTIQIAQPQTSNIKKSSKITVDSLQLKINCIEVILTHQNTNKLAQIYEIKAQHIQFVKQYRNNLKKKVQMSFMAQKISLIRQNQQILNIVVNKISQDNIVWRNHENMANISSNMKNNSKKIIQDYDKVIKNKKRQFSIKLSINTQTMKPYIQIDTLAIQLNIFPIFIQELSNIIQIFYPKIYLYIQNQNKIKQILRQCGQDSPISSNSLPSSTNSNSIFEDQDQQDNQRYDVWVKLKNIAANLSILNIKQKNSLCILNPLDIDVKIKNDEISGCISDRILFYANQLEIMSIQQLYINTNDSQVTLYAGDMQVNLDIKQMVDIFKELNKFYLQQKSIRMLIQNVYKISEIGLNSGVIQNTEKNNNQNQKRETRKMQKIAYVKFNNIKINIGQLNENYIYLPYFLISFTQFKAYISQKTKNLQITLESILCISPHNLSSNSILASPHHTKIITEIKNNQSVKIQIKDPLSIEIQQQNVCMVLNIMDTLLIQKQRPYNKSKCNLFIKVNNHTNKQLSIHEFRSDLHADNLNMNKKNSQKTHTSKNIQNIYQSPNIFKPQIPKQYHIKSRSNSQIILSNQIIQITINEELSQPIDLGLIMKQQLNNQLPIIFSYQEDCLYIVQTQQTSLGVSINIKYRYQLYIFEGIDQKLNHIQKLQISTNRLQSKIYYQKQSRKQNEINKQEQQQIRQQQIYQFQAEKQIKKDQIKADNYADFISQSNKISFGWELLEQQKLDTITIKIQSEMSNHPKSLKISKLISNNIHYKLYGLYSSQRNPQQSQIQPKYNYFYYYILQQIPQANNNGTHKYYLMPFLIFVNHLQYSDIDLRVISKKLGNTQDYKIGKNQSQVAFGGEFDYYMKQYMIKIQLSEQMQSNKKQQMVQLNDRLCFESEEHYFNTFFMVDQSFQSHIELRSQDNRKRYLRIRQSFIKKTKILQIQNSLTLINHTDQPISLSISSENILSKSNIKALNQIPTILSPKSQQFSAKKLKKGDILSFIYHSGQSQSKIDVPITTLLQTDNKVILSFNFCKIANSNKDNQMYNQILFKLQYKQNNLTQSLVLSPFITFTNICCTGSFIKLNNILLSSYIDKQKYTQRKQSMSLYLPSNTNKDYNNKFLPLNIEKIYEDLFLKPQNWILEGDSDIMQISIHKDIGLQATENVQINTEMSIKFSQLLHKKMIQLDNQVYSLIKSMKDEKIQFYFSDRLFNTNMSNIRYYLFNNQTKQNFLMNSGQEQFGKCLFASKQQLQNLSSPTLNPSSQSLLNQKIFIPQYRHKQHLNILLNKDRYDIFLCNAYQQKLESFSLKKLQKLGIKQQKYLIQNFTIMNTEQIMPNRLESQFQLATDSVKIKYNSSKKNIAGLLDIKMINIRKLDSGKIDTLLKDVTFSILEKSNIQQKNSPKKTNQPNNHRKHTIHQIIRIPQQSYFLFQCKQLDEKILLLKNIFIKCKIIDLHVNKHLLSFLVYVQRFIRESLRFSKQILQNNNKNQITFNEQNKYKIGTQNIFQYASNTRILNLVKDKIFLIRSIHLHQANLCLNIQSNSTNNFSNIISLPQFTISNRNYKINALIKDITNHYLANIIAKFPKLSFIYQNLRTPISLVKSLIETREVMAEKDQKQQITKYNWIRSYINLQNQYVSPFGSLSSLKIKSNSQKSAINESLSEKISDIHKQIVSNYLCKQYYTETNQVNERILCKLENVIFCNITKQLPTNLESNQLQYIMTNKILPSYSPSVNMQINSPREQQTSLQQEQVPLNQIESLKILRYNEKNGELIINFRKKGSMLKIVGDINHCDEVSAFIRASIV